MKEKRNNLFYAFIFIYLGILLVFLDITISINKKNQEEKKLNIVINKINNNSIDVNKNKKAEQTKYNYIGVLEIPKIKLKKGLYELNSPHNNVNENIQIINNSTFPTEINSILILAAHSGNSSVSYFKKLYKLEKKDLIYFYYNNKKYKYKIIDYYIEEKTGFITNPNFKNGKYIILTTCKNSLSQLIYIGKLIE